MIFLKILENIFDSRNDSTDSSPNISCCSLESSNSSSSTDNNENSFKKQLRLWAITNNISHTALKSLLKILKLSGGHSSLPSDSRTLLCTPRTNVYKPVEPGTYSHIGIKQAVDKLIQNINKPLQRIDLLINIDGLPLSKSSSSQIYPILCSIFDYPNYVSIIGIYHGYEKPSSANDFLRDLVIEVTQLTQSGFIQEQTLPFIVKGFICDAPAKFFIMYIKDHTGFYSCTKCATKGKYVKDRVCFPNFK